MWAQNDSENLSTVHASQQWTYSQVFASISNKLSVKALKQHSIHKQLSEGYLWGLASQINIQKYVSASLSPWLPYYRYILMKITKKRCYGHKKFMEQSVDMNSEDYSSHIT